MGCPKLTYEPLLKPVCRAGGAEASREEKVSRENPKRTVERGLYYYGARYYDPKVSVWLSVHPLASEAPGWTPYRFRFNNTVNIVDPTGMLDDWYRADDGSLLWKEGTEKIVTIAAGVDNEGNVTASKTYNWAASDGAQLGAEGADVIAIRGNGDNAWQRDAVNTQNANPGSVIALSAYSDDVGMSSKIPGLENVTSSFGKVNSITLRDHSTANYNGGVAGVFTNNLLSTFNSKVSGGSIKMDACAGVSFFGCYNASDARSFTLSTGITSYGSTAKVGMESFRNGTYNSGVRGQGTVGSFMKYSRYSNYVSTSGYSISSQKIGRVIGGINYR